MLYRLGVETAASWLKDLLSGASLINPTSQDYREAANTVLRFADQPITLVDATLAALGSRLGIEIWTYDHHFDLMHAGVWR